jgi:6-pyruvoyltetrahydropterin/6-carboxytetrahydropterin synthase
LISHDEIKSALPLRLPALCFPRPRRYDVRMEAELVRTFRFEAAHALPDLPQGHKCRRMHGHSYRVDIHVTGQVDEQTGWVVDFGRIKQVVEPIIARLDHSLLNEVPGLANSTSEQIARYLWDHIGPELPILSAVTIWESDNSRCIYRGK